MKIKYTGYIELNDALLEEYYGDGEYKTYKCYRLLGVDGTEIELQHGEEINKTFGKVDDNKVTINASKATVVYDLLNELVIDSEMNMYNSSERTKSKEQFRRIKSKGQQRRDIVVADRGFPSLEVLSELKELGYDFVIRYNGENFLKETLPLVGSSKREMEIEIPLRYGKQRKNNPAIKQMLEKGYPDRIKVRVIKIELTKSVTEYLITSILSKDGFTLDDFKQIYNYRWNEETYFDFQKNVMEVENFSGKTVESIKQDYYSRILVGNLHTLIVSDAQEEIDKETHGNDDLKYKQYKVNKSISFGLMKDSIYDLLTVSNWQEEYNNLVKEVKRYKIPVIKNRTYPRKKKGNLKFPINKRRVL